MWKKKQSAKRLTTAKIDTLIGRRVEIIGEFIFSAGLHIEGTVRGDVTAREGEPAFLTVGAAGVIEGDVRVPSVVLNGRVVGDLICADHVELKQKAVVTGDVHYQVLEMARGAEVNGSLIHCSDEEGGGAGHDGQPGDLMNLRAK
jgi:cytoskeletal protein CcmA (bactofilin family)